MIALVDCNNFYASCERLFQPALQGKPVIVLSNNDGCVIARSDEAKELGIEMGTPAFQMKELIDQYNVAVFSSNYTLYGSLSDRVMHVLNEHCPAVEVYSIDEAFLFLGDIHGITLEKYSQDLRAAVKAVGIPVSVGVAPSKTLAKMANRFAKKTKKHIGVHVLDSDQKIDEVLRFTEVEDIWGIGKQYAKLLRSHGFNTAYDLSQAPEEWMRKNMTVVGHRMCKELRGIPCIELEEEPPAKKNICVSRSFGQLLTDKASVHEALADYTARAAEKLRSQKSCASAMQVFIQTNFFRYQDKQYARQTHIELPVPTSSTPELLYYAGEALNQIFRDGYNYKKVGIMLLQLVPDSQVQQGMFDARDRERENRLMKAMDAINGSFGQRGLVRLARQSYGKRWKLRQERLSPRYTTRINEVLTINI